VYQFYKIDSYYRNNISIVDSDYIMAANGIELKPIRMADLVSKTPSSTSIGGMKAGKYIPPGKRTVDQETYVNIDMGNTTHFPSLGGVPKKVVAWGNSNIEPTPELDVVRPQEKKSLGDKIKEKIRLNAIEDSERMMQTKEDTSHMTDKELAYNGWTTINIPSGGDSYIDTSVSDLDPYIPGFIRYADSGMSFHEYVNFTLLAPLKNPL
jgi:hypothetical protein